jgi:hypothetical protein
MTQLNWPHEPARLTYACRRARQIFPLMIDDHITAGLLADPALIRAEIDKRLEQARTSDPAGLGYREMVQASGPG